MRRYRGAVTLELTEGASVQTIHETNMVTDAVNDLLGLNPMGQYFNAAAANDGKMQWNDEMLPICPNLLGGILIFSTALTEQAGNIYAPVTNVPVAYASNDVNNTANTKRGSMNLVESKPIEDGYRFVWEFSPSQGNGTIAAVGLTHKKGGANAYGSDVAVNTTLLQLRSVALSGATVAELNSFFRAVEVDFEHGKTYSIAYSNRTVTVSRFRLPVFDLGLNEKLDDTTLMLEDDTVLEPETFKFYGTYTPYGTFLDGEDGYWYGFSNQANSSGDATMLWIKIKKEDLTFTEGSWTLSNAKLKAVGSFTEGGSYPGSARNAVMRGGYLYVPAYDGAGIYKINVANHTGVTLIPLGFTSAIRSIGGLGNCTSLLARIGQMIVGYDFMIDGADRVIATAGGERYTNLATPIFQYKEFGVAWGGSYGSEFRYNYLITP